MRTRTPMLLAAVLVVGVTVGVAADPTANVSSPPAPTPETALASLNTSIEWYRQARVTMRGVNRAAEAPAAAVVRAAGGPGTGAVVARLIRLPQSRGSMDDLRAATVSLSRSVSSELRATAEQLRPPGARLSALAESPDTAAAADAEREFRTGRAPAKALPALLSPLREHASLLRRYGADAGGLARAVDAETRGGV